MSTIPLSDWSHAVVDVPGNGLSRERTMSVEALAVLAKQLGMISLVSVSAAYRIERLAAGAYRLKGRVVTEGQQACVVSLEPIASHVEEDFDVEFWPDLPDAEGGEDKAILNARDVEPLDAGVIPVGRIVFECISAGLDPYPRKPDAAFTWTDKAESAPEKVSPFAALAKLKGNPDKT